MKIYNFIFWTRKSRPQSTAKNK